MIEKLTTKLRGEPAVVIGLLATLLVGVAAHYNIVLDEAQLELALAPLVTSLLIRTKVSPAK